jgi:hypothetical protein
VRKRLGGQLTTRRRRQLPFLAELLEYRAVAIRGADRGDVDEVLGGGTQHGRSADVDHLDGVFLADVLLARDGRERIEVDADEIERLDAVLLECREIVLRIAPGEDGRVDARVQRLDAPAEELGNVGQLVDRRDREAELGDVRSAPAARHEVDPEVGEPACELVETGLVEDRDERTLHQGARSVVSRPDRGRPRAAAGGARLPAGAREAS